MNTPKKNSAQPSPICTVELAAVSVCSETDIPISEQELDLHIRDCGRRMVAAMAAGDRADCDQWRERMYAAIRSRTPEHQARLTERIDSAIWFQSPAALEMGKGAA